MSSDKRLDAVTDKDVIAWKRKLQGEGKSQTTLSMYHRALRAAFNRAIKWKLAKENPFEQVEVAKTRPRAPGEKDMSIDEVRQLLNTIDEADDRRFALYVRMVLYTGCRRNEILYVRWEDIDMEQQTLTIQQHKTGRVLVLPVNKALRGVLELVEMQESGYVFQTNSGSRRAKFREQPWNESYVTTSFKKYVRAAGLSNHFTIHSLRHTYATYLRQKGVPLDIVQKLLGHASPRVTSDNYDHSFNVTS